MDSNKEKIESDATPSNQFFTDDYKLCGYLAKYNSNSFKTQKAQGTSSKKRWFVYSDSTCKLYYYKSNKDPEPLGEIDVALSSLSYSEDCCHNGIFTISSGGKEYILDSDSPQNRLHWLQSLQNARREFNERLNLVNYRSSRTSIGRPKSGLVQDKNPFPEATPDPHNELVEIMNKSLDSSLKAINDDKEPRKSDLHLSFNIFRSSVSPPKQETNSPSRNSIPDIESGENPRSPLASPIEIIGFEKLSRKFRSSIRIKKPKFVSKFTPESPEEICKKCIQLKEDLNSANEETCRERDRCEAYKEAIQLVQKDLESIQMEKKTWSHLEKLMNNANVDEDILAIFREKDRKIVELEHNQHQMRNLLSTLTSNLRDSRLHNEHMEEKVEILTSVIESKDNAVVDLSLKIDNLNKCIPQVKTDTESSSTFYSSIPLTSYPRPGTISIGTQTVNLELESLRDKLEGYKCQNTFLNKEILELNLILKQRHEREQKLISESSNWEAKFYQIQSKYLLLLNDLHSPHANHHDSSILSQLLQDVVHSQGPADLRIVECKGKEYNEYGFCVSAPTGSDILTQSEFIQKQSRANAWFAEQQKNSNMSINWESQWESFLACTNAKELPHHPELKYLIREGIPYQYKGRVWRLLIESQIGKLKASLSASYYHDLLALSTSTSTLDPSAKQIELDLLRTLPNNRHYESPYADGIPKLRRVLLAYSKHNLAVGYCQGLNRLGAIALLFLNEEDAFWCLVYIIEYLMPRDYYSRNLLGSQVDQRVLKDLMGEKLPRIAANFEEHGLDVSLFTFNWFLCIYIDAIPPSTYLYIWDSFLYEGTKVLFRFALSIFKLCEEDILSKKDYMSIFDYLRSVPDQVMNLKKLKHMAFRWANPLSIKYIRSRREHHRVIVETELEEVEEVRKTFYQTKSEKNGNESIGDGEDEIGEEGEQEKPKDDSRKSSEENNIPKKVDGDCDDSISSKTRNKSGNGYEFIKWSPQSSVLGDMDDENFEVISLKKSSASEFDEEDNG